MNRRHLIAAAVLVALASACSEPAPPPPPPPAPAPATADARIKLYTTCWDQFNAKAFDQFQNCFSDDATSEAVDSVQPKLTGRAAIMDVIKKEAESFPDRKGELKLVLGNGSRIAGVALYTATNTGPMPGPDGKPMPATNKKIGLLMGHTIELDAMGTHAARESAYVEEGTVAGQLGLSKHAGVRPVMAATGGAPEIVIAKNDATETANIAAVRAMMDAGNKHDIKAVEAMLTDDYKLVEIGQPKDLDKKAAIASNKDFLKAFPDITSTASDVWAAGDYVVIVGKVDGTNKGAFPGMGIMKATGKKFTGRFLEICKMENGKVKQDWLFYNGSTLATQLGMK